MDRVQILAHSQGHSRRLGNTAISAIVVRDCWLLEPEQVKGLECLGCCNCLVDTHRIIRVNHKGDIRPDQISHCFDTRDILGQLWLADLDLQAIEAARQISAYAVKKLGERKTEIDSATVG